MADVPLVWSALGAETTACPSASGLINLSNGNHALGAEIDNTHATLGYYYAHFKLKVRGADAFHAGDYVSVWFLKASDGTNYEDGAAGTPGTTPARPADLVFPVRAVSTQQVIDIGPVTIPGCKFKCLVQNNCTHGFTNTADENVLLMYAITEVAAA
jgi:hypothetical protein